jgi:hypothetical protein
MTKLYILSCNYPYYNKYYKKFERWHVDIGIFTSLKKAHKTMYKWPREFAYIISTRIQNKDYKKEIKQGMTSEDHWHYGVDYYADFKKEKNIKFSLMWPLKSGSKKSQDRDLDPIKDKKLIKRYRKYMKNIGQKFHKINLTLN